MRMNTRKGKAIELKVSNLTTKSKIITVSSQRMYDWYEQQHPGWKENHDKWLEITDEMWLKFATDLSYRQGFRDGFAVQKTTVISYSSILTR
jgi:hypothetical protein